MRARLFHYFEKWLEQHKDDPLREDAFTRVERVYHLLKPVTPIEDDSVIPLDSLLQEFIGGSCYDYQWIPGQMPYARKEVPDAARVTGCRPGGTAG